MAVGASAFALFTKNQRQWFSTPLQQTEIEKFKAEVLKSGIEARYILPHDSYLINLGSPDPEGLEKSRASFLEEMQRCEQLGLTMLNFHPGSHLKLVSEAEGCRIIADSVRRALQEVPEVKAVFENTAGQGSNLGYSFEQLAVMLEMVDMPDRCGVCIDSCHAFAAGYDLASDEGFEKCFAEFDRLIGMEYLCGMHLNDAKGGLAGHLDRHAPLGKGTIGMAFFEKVAKDRRFDNIPLILETPDESLWQSEISTLLKIASE